MQTFNREFRLPGRSPIALRNGPNTHLPIQEGDCLMLDYLRLRVELTVQEKATMLSLFDELIATAGVGEYAEEVRTVLDNVLSTRGEYAVAKRELDDISHRLSIALEDLGKLHDKVVIELANVNFNAHPVQRTGRAWHDWREILQPISDIRNEYETVAKKAHAAYRKDFGQAVEIVRDMISRANSNGIQP